METDIRAATVPTGRIPAPADSAALRKTSDPRPRAAAGGHRDQALSPLRPNSLAPSLNSAMTGTANT